MKARRAAALAPGRLVSELQAGIRRSYDRQLQTESIAHRWHTGHSDYPLMIVGIYATLGVFLIMASSGPLKHLSLIWFTVWSSLVHAAIMGIQSFESLQNHGHLVGDVPALIIAAVVLALLTPRGRSEMPLGAKTY
jgi:hypothetical protein